MVQKIEYTVLDMIETAVRNVKATPLNLGGVSGEDGGSGGPPGGIIGKLPQNKVTFDLTEAETLDIVGSGSLVDNLNRIRYRIGQLESGGVASSGVVVIDDDEDITYDPTTTIHFSGVGVAIDDLGDGEIRVIIQGGGDVEEAPIDGQTYGRKDGAWVTVSGGGGEPLVYDDLTSQIDGIVSHFDFISEAPSGILLYWNGVFQPSIYYEVDMDGLGVTTDFVPSLDNEDTLVAVYGSASGGGGASAFTGLTDTPSSYTGQGGKIVAVKSDVTGLEFITPAAGGGNLEITFDVSTTTAGQNQNRTSGGTYTAHRAYITMTQPVKLDSVKWDVGAAKTYTLKIYRGWQFSTLWQSLGNQITAGQTAEVTWDAGDMVLMPGRWVFEITWTGAAVVDDNTVDSSIANPQSFRFFSIDRTQYDTTFDTNFSAAIKLVAYLGEESIS